MNVYIISNITFDTSVALGRYLSLLSESGILQKLMQIYHKQFVKELFKTKN